MFRLVGGDAIPRHIARPSRTACSRIKWGVLTSYVMHTRISATLPVAYSVTSADEFPPKANGPFFRLAFSEAVAANSFLPGASIRGGFGGDSF
jgi:hypothetical protein